VHRAHDDAVGQRREAEIEGGELGLEDSLAKYERGTFLIQHCRGVLGAAEKQIELLSKPPDGGLQSEPMPLPGSRQQASAEPEPSAAPGAADERGID
jgi:exodeoxyribonuclease VII small subunit